MSGDDQNFGIDFLGHGNEGIHYNSDYANPISFTGCGNMPDPLMMIATNTHYLPAPVDIYTILWGLQLPRADITLGEDFMCNVVVKEKKKVKKEKKRSRFLNLFRCCFGR